VQIRTTLYLLYLVPLLILVSYTGPRKLSCLARGVVKMLRRAAPPPPPINWSPKSESVPVPTQAETAAAAKALRLGGLMAQGRDLWPGAGVVTVHGEGRRTRVHDSGPAAIPLHFGGWVGTEPGRPEPAPLPSGQEIVGAFAQKRPLPERQFLKGEHVPAQSRWPPPPTTPSPQHCERPLRGDIHEILTGRRTGNAGLPIVHGAEARGEQLASILMLRGQSCAPGTVGTPVKGGGTSKKKAKKHKPIGKTMLKIIIKEIKAGTAHCSPVKNQVGLQAQWKHNGNHALLEAGGRITNVGFLEDVDLKTQGNALGTVGNLRMRQAGNQGGTK